MLAESVPLLVAALSAVQTYVVGVAGFRSLEQDCLVLLAAAFTYVAGWRAGRILR